MRRAATPIQSCLAARGFLGLLGLIPKRVHFLKRALLRPLSLSFKSMFYSVEPACKFCICPTQGRFRVHAQMAAKVDHHEKQVAKLLLDLVGTERVARLLQFGGFFGDLGQNLRGRGPVKPHARSTFLQLLRPHERRKTRRDTVQRAALRLARAFSGLDLFPIHGLLVRALVAAFVAKDMRVSRDHLVRDVAHHVLKREMPRLLRHLRVVDRLKQQIAQFALQLTPIAALDRVGNLIGFFNRIGGNRVEILLYVPRASRLWVAQSAHDFNKAVYPCVRVVDQRIIRH